MNSDLFDTFLSTLGDSFCHICKWNAKIKLVNRTDPNSGNGEINKLLTLKECVSPDTVIMFFKSQDFINNIDTAFSLWLKEMRHVDVNNIIQILFSDIIEPCAIPCIAPLEGNSLDYMLNWRREILPCLKYIQKHEYFVRHGIEKRQKCRIVTGSQHMELFKHLTKKPFLFNLVDLMWQKYKLRGDIQLY